MMAWFHHEYGIRVCHDQDFVPKYVDSDDTKDYDDGDVGTSVNNGHVSISDEEQNIFSWNLVMQGPGVIAS